MKSLIIGNWKCNPTNLKKAKKLFEGIRNGLKKKLRKTEVVVCPPFVYLPKIRSSSKIKLGAQDCFWEEKGSFTGEVSPSMLKDIGVNYVILGHSERRKYFGETDQTVNKKIKKSLKTGINPMLCVGETKKERKEGKKGRVIEGQIKEGLNKVSAKDVKKIIIAYEPRWAIGSGKNCSVDETMSSILIVKKTISNIYSRSAADKVRVLYGGSVTSDNALRYITEAQANGLLIGGASLKREEFLNIINLIEKRKK